MQKECTELSFFDLQQKKSYLLSYNLQFFAKDGEGGQKTEPATAKKLNDARQEGKVAKSKELDAAFGLLVLFLCLKVFVGMVGENLLSIFYFVYEDMGGFTLANEAHFTTRLLSAYINEILVEMMIILLPFFIFGVVVGFLVNLVQVGWVVSAKPMKPKLSKINPIGGFKRIFSTATLVELLKSVLKLAVIGVVVYTSIKNNLNDLFILYELTIQQAITMAGTIIIDVGIKISAVYLVLGFLDYAYQKRKFSEDMKMTKQEVKDEYKNAEGDPQVKSKQRSKMMEVSRRRMMQAVPQADVVITNPTHIAVALKYDSQVSAAPIVVAKGEDYLALKIKELAKESGVEIVENKPLARMLNLVDLGAEIPAELYEPVATILSAIFNKRQGYRNI